MEDNWWIAIGYEPMWVNMKIYPKLIQLCDPTGSGVPGLQGAVPSCFWTRQPCSWEPGNLGISIFLRCILFRSKLCQGTSVDPHLAWWACTTKWALGSDRNSGNFSRNKLSYAVSSSKSWNWIEAVAWHFSGTGFWQPPLRCQYSDSCTIVVLRHARKKKAPGIRTKALRCGLSGLWHNNPAHQSKPQKESIWSRWSLFQLEPAVLHLVGGCYSQNLATGLSPPVLLCGHWLFWRSRPFSRTLEKLPRSPAHQKKRCFEKIWKVGTNWMNAPFKSKGEISFLNRIGLHGKSWCRRAPAASLGWSRTCQTWVKRNWEPKAESGESKELWRWDGPFRDDLLTKTSIYILNYLNYIYIFI